MLLHRVFQQLHYLSLPAPPAVAEFVDGFWQIVNRSPTSQPFTVLPDGFFKVLRRQAPGHPAYVRLSGLWTQPQVISLPAHGTVVGIRFKLAAAEWFGQPLPLNAGHSLAPDHWLHPALAAPELADVARLTSELLAARPVVPATQALFAALYRGAGQWPVAQVAAAAGWLPRQVNRYFQRQFGLPLKQYSNLLRAYVAARQLQPAALWPLGNYHDQSHGIRQLKHYTGHTPRQLYQRRLDRFIQLCPPIAADLCPT